MRRRGLRVGIRALALIAVAAVAATAAATQSKGATVSKVAATKCGEIPFKLPPDPDGVLKGLPQSVLAAYNNYLATGVKQSPWINFKPKKSKGFVIGYSNSFSGNYWRADLLSELKKDYAIAKKAGLVSKFIVTDSNLKNDVQIQQVRSMIQQHVDLILAIPNSATAMNGVFAEAYKAGIPVVTIDAPTTSPYTVDVDNQNWLTGALAGKGLVQKLGGKGNVVMIDGLAGAPGSVLLHNGAAAVFKTCPNIKVLASAPGNWNEADAKAAMLQVLATHPQKIDGVYAQGGSILGVIQAFQQTGRPLPALADGNPDKSTLGWIGQNLGKVKYVASINPPKSAGNAAWRVAMRMLLGQRLTIKAIPALPPLVTSDAVLRKWIPKSWTPKTTGQAPAPPGTQWIPNSMLDLLFRPAPLPVQFPAP